MSYLDSMLSPYRGDLGEEIGEILSGDHEMACREIQVRGLIFLIAYTMIMLISFLKVICHTFDHYSKPERPRPQITREMVDRARSLTPMYTIKEAGNYNNPQYKSKNQQRKAYCIQELRKFLYNNNLTLRGYVLKEINHRVDDRAFINSIISGEEMAKFTTTYITFGEYLDNMLYEVLPTKPKKKTIQGKKCLAFENDYGFMVQELKQIYQEPIKVKFDSI